MNRENTFRDRSRSPDELDELLTVGELADKLKVRRSWVYSKTREREIPTVRVGRHVRFFFPAVLAWLQEQGGRTR